MKIWDDFLLKMEEKFGQPTIQRWVRTISINRFDARNLYLESMDPLQIAWFEEHIRPHIKGSFFNNNERSIQVHLNLIQSKDPEDPKSPPKPTYSIHSDRLDPELCFANFIPSPENIVTYKLISDLNSPLFNPIYIYGPKHSGKTHLLIAAALSLQAIGKKVFYVRSETFTSHVVQAIRLGLMTQFRNIYRNIDALFIDGIEFIAKKEATQEEFFHTFNHLHTMGKTIILSSQLPPSKLQDIEQRLVSRFEWGISLKIEPIPPLVLLQNKAKLWNLSYSDELLSYLAANFSNDPLIALQALSLRSKGMSSLTPEKAEGFLQDLFAQKKTQVLTSEKIIETIAQHFGIKPEDILGKSQQKEFAQPRQIAMFFCRQKLQLPFQKIGEIFGRDHSTVMSSVRNIEKNEQLIKSFQF